jgi:uncharacterized membrane protein
MANLFSSPPNVATLIHFLLLDLISGRFSCGFLLFAKLMNDILLWLLFARLDPRFFSILHGIFYRINRRWGSDRRLDHFFLHLFDLGQDLVVDESIKLGSFLVSFINKLSQSIDIQFPRLDLTKA